MTCRFETNPKTTMGGKRKADESASDVELSGNDIDSDTPKVKKPKKAAQEKVEKPKVRGLRLSVMFS